MGNGPDACGARRMAWRRLGLVVLAVAVFLGTAGALRTVQGPLRSRNRGALLEAFLAQKDEVDAVFIGSSRVQRGVSPAVIDERLSSPGREFRSFNLGIPGMRSFEADWLVRQVLASEPARLRFVVVEAPDFEPEIFPKQDTTARSVDWHDPRAAWLVLRAVWRSEASFDEKLAASWRTLRFLVLRTVNYATGDRFRLRAAPAWGGLVAGWVRSQGFQALDETVPGVAHRRERFLRQAGFYRAMVAGMRAHARSGTLADPGWKARYDRRSLEEQEALIREAGFTPVYLATPRLLQGPDFAALQSEGAIEHLVDLRDPLVHPRLFAVEYRFDREHLNEEGAAIMSRKIAEQLAPLVSTVRNEGGA